MYLQNSLMIVWKLYLIAIVCLLREGASQFVLALTETVILAYALVEGINLNFRDINLDTFWAEQASRRSFLITGMLNEKLVQLERS